ncbi:type II restriction endonuclease [Legionella septentrionalis]|uniref:type II restriction endonuclease n=1 Tax=Legionella septentrionalis TaxID=2498109 RepID=UPI000F8C40D6|nr:type II restriction endonuclease [Legionella septentrionalis]RUR14028.1 restriction endonuclease [Legionella septentrionalis]
MSDFGELKDYIKGAAIKRLSVVECDLRKSNQHEINGVQPLKKFLGDENQQFGAVFIRLDDDEENISQSSGTVTWYDSRKGNPNRSAEYRLYYSSNPAIKQASAGDVLIVILKKAGDIVLATAPADSQSERELNELFGKDIKERFNTVDFSDSHDEISLTKRYILEELGIEIKADFGRNYLEIIEKEFGGLVFPKSVLFSRLARNMCAGLDDYPDSDTALISWWDTEEAMFRQLEGELINQKLSNGFSDAEDFLSFSQTIRQRRSSRAGRALENHLAFLFDEKKIRYSWGEKTEQNKKPDFIFPSIQDYRNPDFPASSLTMLGVKTTCKDRWRQVLSEAKRVTEKHLFTLQPGITQNQTDEMIASGLQLVIPHSIHSTYSEKQRQWLWNMEEFVTRIKKLENNIQL